jgi:hypothetical protein
MPLVVRSVAIRAAWRRVRNASDLRDLWNACAQRLGEALDEDFDHTLMARFAERVHLLADEIGRREELLAGSGRALAVAMKVMDDTLLTRNQEVRGDEVMNALVRLDALDDDEDLA